MHHKFWVIDECTVINGSLNWSHSAWVRNYENFSIVQDRSTAKQFIQAFKDIWNDLRFKKLKIDPHVNSKRLAEVIRVDQDWEGDSKIIDSKNNTFNEVSNNVSPFKSQRVHSLDENDDMSEAHLNKEAIWQQDSKCSFLASIIRDNPSDFLSENSIRNA